MTSIRREMSRTMNGRSDKEDVDERWGGRRPGVLGIAAWRRPRRCTACTDPASGSWAGSRSYSPQSGAALWWVSTVRITLMLTRSNHVRRVSQGFIVVRMQWLNYSARSGGSLQARGLKSRSSNPKGREQRWGSRKVFGHSRHSVCLLWHLNSVSCLQRLSTPSMDKRKWQNDR